MVARNCKTKTAECHTANAGKIGNKTAVVSAAFVRPPGVPDDLLNKLARLNELLLYRTFSIAERRDDGHYISMSRDEWVSEFSTSHYTEVKEAAILAGIIESNYRWSSGRPGTDPFPTSVRLTNKFRDGRTKLWELTRKTRSRAEPIDARNLGGTGLHLASMLPRFAIAGTPETMLDAITARLFQGGRHRPHRCSYGRFHSTATALPRYLRSTLYLSNNRTHMNKEEGRESPAPGFSSVAESADSHRRGLSAEFGLDCTGPVGPIRANRAAADRLRALEIKNGSPTAKSGAADLAHLDVANCQSLCIAGMAVERFGLTLPADAGHWLDLCEAGQLYEAIRDWLSRGEIPPYPVSWRGRTLTIDPSQWDRSKVKHQFMVAIFGRLEQSATDPIWQAVERMFPSIAELCLEIKRGGYQRLAHACQRMESSTIIDGVCGHLAQHYPDLPVLTVHDCLIVPADTELLIRDLLAEHFTRRGVRPFIRREV